MAFEQESEFIDAEDEFQADKYNFENIIVRQIQRTADVLSKSLEQEMAVTRKGGVSILQGDARLNAINSVKVLNDLLNPFIKDKDLKDKMKKIIDDLSTKKKEIGEKEVLVKGRGYMKAKNTTHSKGSMPYEELIEAKLEAHRQLFSVLIEAYNKYKNAIKSYGEE